MRAFLAAPIFCLFAMMVPEQAHARRHHVADPMPLAGLLRQNVMLLQQQSSQIQSLRRDLQTIHDRMSPNLLSTIAAASELLPPQNPAMLAIRVPEIIVTPDRDGAIHVFPATALETGQWGDNRGSHRHAGIDLAGVWGSPIVASFSGEVLSICAPPRPCQGKSPGRDSGYGPLVILIRGDDGIVYRYAHLSRVIVKIGQRVLTGERIGSMGQRGQHPHLHFEMIPWAEYRMKPYGLHRLNPNDYLGGHRGSRIVAGATMKGFAAIRYAELHAPKKPSAPPVAQALQFWAWP